jgi:hypothetical protein
MTMSTLILHNDRFDSQKVSLDQLRALPEPERLGPHHRPIHHARFVEALCSEADRRGYEITRTQLGLSRNAGTLFGVLDLRRTAPALTRPAPVPVTMQDRFFANLGLALRPADTAAITPPDHVTALGFRTSTDSTVAPQGRAGGNVMVCDNLMLAGEAFAFKHKSTSGLNLAAMVSDGFERFVEHSATFEATLAALKAAAISNDAAKIRIYDIFVAGLLPSRLFDDVDKAYFQATSEMTDCTPRSAWGLYNACTRAARQLSPSRRFEATAALGREFKLSGLAA